MNSTNAMAVARFPRFPNPRTDAERTGGPRTGVSRAAAPKTFFAVCAAGNPVPGIRRGTREAWP